MAASLHLLQSVPFLYITQAELGLWGYCVIHILLKDFRQSTYFIIILR